MAQVIKKTEICIGDMLSGGVSSGLNFVAGTEPVKVENGQVMMPIEMYLEGLARRIELDYRVGESVAHAAMRLMSKLNQDIRYGKMGSGEKTMVDASEYDKMKLPGLLDTMHKLCLFIEMYIAIGNHVEDVGKKIEDLPEREDDKETLI